MPRKRILKEIEKAFPEGFYAVLPISVGFDTEEITLCPKCFKKYLELEPPIDGDENEGVYWRVKKLGGEVECHECKKKIVMPVKVQKKKPKRRKIEIGEDWVK
jgi:hypothetical protein